MDPRQGNVINNQEVPSAEQQATILSLKSVSTFISCPGCKSLGVTRSESNFNFITLLLCCYCGPCFNCYQSCNAKEFNCYDTTHYCQNCNNQVGKYVSC